MGKPGPPSTLAAMGLGLLFPLLLLWTRGTQGATLDPTGQHVCIGSRWVLWESDYRDGGWLTWSHLENKEVGGSSWT